MDRFITTVKPILALISGVCVIALVYQLTPTAVSIGNIGFVSWTNSSLDVLNNTILSDVQMMLSFQDENQTLFNITAPVYKTKQPTPLAPTIISLAIVTFISVVTTFIFAAFSALIHTISYQVNLWRGHNIETVSGRVTQKLYKTPQSIQDTEQRKSYIKALSPPIADTFKKCWGYASSERK
jgi:hypothetical protein